MHFTGGLLNHTCEDTDIQNMHEHQRKQNQTNLQGKENVSNLHS